MTSKYEEIKQFLQTCGNIRAELRTASKQLNAAVYQLESDNRLLLKALELAHKELQIENMAYERYTPEYWIEQAGRKNRGSPRAK